MDRPSFSIEVRSVQDHAVLFQVSGFFSKDAAEDFVRKVETGLEAGRFCCIIDLSACQVLASPGIAAILRMALRVVDDFQGKVVIIGLDDSKRSFLKITGVIPLVETAADLVEAEALLRRPA